jgi:cell division protein FtsB
MSRVRTKKTAPRKITQVLKRFNRRKRARNLIILVLFSLLLIFFASGPRGTYQLFHFYQQKTALEQEIKNLQLKKVELEYLKKKIENDPAYIEKIAREKYKMKKKDEQVYHVVEDE